MKLLAILFAIGFCLMAIAPLSAILPVVQRCCVCCMAEERSDPGEMPNHSPGGMQACSCGNHTHTEPKAMPSCGGLCSPLVALPSQPISTLLRFRNDMVRGYRRITTRNILNHNTRREIYEQIVALPGVDIKTLLNITGINENTLRYHIKKIEREAKIRVVTIGGVGHYFENHDTYSDEEQILLSRMFISGSNSILQMVSDNPGLTRGELADHLGVSGPTVTRSIRPLIDERCITVVKDGRYTRYYPNWRTESMKNPLFASNYSPALHTNAGAP